MEVLSKPPSRKRGLLRSSVAAAVMLLAAEMFFWNLVDAVTPFLAGPLLAIAWLGTAIIGIVAVAHAVIHWRRGWHVLVPVAIVAGALAAAMLVPFTRLWLWMDFNLKRDARERVVQQVHSGELKPNVKHNADLIRLDGSTLSMGGNELWVGGPSQRPFVFFFTYRGILDNYSGFLWVPDGENPGHFKDLNEPTTEILPFGGNWFFISHH